MPDQGFDRRQFIARMTTGAIGIGLSSIRAGSQQSQVRDRLWAGWLNPPRSYRPHTRWWWPGNAVTIKGISWQLEQMHAQGMGGVEIMSAWDFYAKGNIPYLSEEWGTMVRHAVRKAAELDMEVSLNFGPGWNFGGSWVPVEERSKVLAPGWQDVSGPGTFDAELPPYNSTEKASSLLQREGVDWTAPDDGQIVAAVAGSWDAGSNRLQGDSLIDLTSRVERGRLNWDIPAGQWRIMAFRIKYTGQQNPGQNFFPRNWIVDHMSEVAMQHYCQHLIDEFSKVCGQDFGKTVDSFFCDSFEVHPLPNSVLWSTDTLEKFKGVKGYDLAPYLPAIWFDIGDLTPKVRYDVNEFLHRLGLKTVFATFSEASAARKVQARIQPYYCFTEELIQGAGVTPRPETEMTTARFEPMAEPRKTTVAGAHFYGREIVSAEAFTFMSRPRYRTTLQDLKVATDAFLRDGVTQFYNHGYAYSPENDVAPSRDWSGSNGINHWSPWWKYYHHLAAYTSRAAFLLRQGTFAGDVLVYSPQATVWTELVLFGVRNRILPYGNLAKTLVANGYDFDPVNDDVLQNYARVEDGRINVRALSYRFLVLPNVAVLPLETAEFIRKFVLMGGIVIALGQLPGSSVGLEKHSEKDEKVRQIVRELFETGRQDRRLPGNGWTYHLPDYQIVAHKSNPLEPYSLTPPMDANQSAFIGALRRHLPPDFSLEGGRQSDGLTFLHQRNGKLDVYFVANMQPSASTAAVSFRVTGKSPKRWDPNTGEIKPVHHYRVTSTAVEIPLDLSPWESTFIVFSPGADSVHVTRTDLAEVTKVSETAVVGIAAANGMVAVEVERKGQSRTAKRIIANLPPPLSVAGKWKLSLEGTRFPKLEKEVRVLQSWTDDLETRYCSGTGTYELKFDLPQAYLRPDLQLLLDLGSVCDIAEVVLNARSVGVCWMTPYRLEVTREANPGANRLRILVTNSLMNHVAGMKKSPEVPANLVSHYGTDTDVYPTGAAVARSEMGFKPLAPAGLLGPVQIIPRRRVAIRLY